MTCAVQHCQAEAVGVWRWTTPCGEIRMNVPMCEEHRAQKHRSQAPGRFDLYETTP